MSRQAAGPLRASFWRCLGVIDRGALETRLDYWAENGSLGAWEGVGLLVNGYKGTGGSFLGPGEGVTNLETEAEWLPLSPK